MTFTALCAFILDAWQLTGSDHDTAQKHRSLKFVTGFGPTATSVRARVRLQYSLSILHATQRGEKIDAEPARDEGKQINISNIATSIRIRLCWPPAATYTDKLRLFTSPLSGGADFAL